MLLKCFANTVAVVHSVVSVTGFHRRPHYFDTFVFSTRLEIHIFQGKTFNAEKSRGKSQETSKSQVVRTAGEIGRNSRHSRSRLLCITAGIWWRAISAGVPRPARGQHESCLRLPPTLIDKITLTKVAWIQFSQILRKICKM